MNKWIKISGYSILAGSCIIWGMILVVPFLGLSVKKVALLTTILIISGEITFYLSIFILGKSIIEKIKKILLFWKKKPEGGSQETEDGRLKTKDKSIWSGKLD
jgi:hypothetical protein